MRNCEVLLKESVSKQEMEEKQFDYYKMETEKTTPLTAIAHFNRKPYSVKGKPIYDILQRN